MSSMASQWPGEAWPGLWEEIPVGGRAVSLRVALSTPEAELGMRINSLPNTAQKRAACRGTELVGLESHTPLCCRPHGVWLLLGISSPVCDQEATPAPPPLGNWPVLQSGTAKVPRRRWDVETLGLI